VGDIDLTPRVEGAIRLPGGRRQLGYAEYGAPEGKPMFWFHGTPGARRQVPPMLRDAAGERGVRVIALERPGVGVSTCHLYKDFRGWAADVGHVADHFGFDRFACVGLSGGGPYVLACAHEHADRMAVGIVLGGVAPSRGPEAAPGGLVALAARFGWLIERGRVPAGLGAWCLVRLLEPFGSQAFDLYMRISPPGDQEVFARPEMKAMFLDDLTLGYKRQLHAPISDIVLFTREWGFSLRNIKVPVRFWHGTADNIVPLSHAQHLVDLVPDAYLRVRSGESHLGSLDAADEILDTVLELWDVPAREEHTHAVEGAVLGTAGS
jgi:pimeloyl-ACP methyl ester carboxylesterase